jgi:hypothetical protein
VFPKAGRGGRTWRTTEGDFVRSLKEIAVRVAALQVGQCTQDESTVER